MSISEELERLALAVVLIAALVYALQIGAGGNLR